MIIFVTKKVVNRPLGSYMQASVKARIAELTKDSAVSDLAVELSNLTKGENGPENFEEAVKRAEKIITQGKEFVK